MALRFPSTPPSILPEAVPGLRAAAAKHHISHYLREKLSKAHQSKSYTTLPPYALPSLDESKALCLRDLERLWASQPNAPTFDFLWNDYAAHHAWAWSHDPYTGGAFALFGPGQFGHLYPRFLRPFCDNKFALCGEALSAHHAWISGALDSAYGAVMRWLLAMGRLDEASHLKASPFGGGVDVHAEEFDDTTLHWAAELSGSKKALKLPVIRSSVGCSKGDGLKRGLTCMRVGLVWSSGGSNRGT